MVDDRPVNLFGEPITTVNDTPHSGPRKRKATVKRGYAWTPGTGPQGETCGSCQNHIRKVMAKTYHKCALMKAHWTGGAGSDIAVKSPACRHWEKETS